MARAMGCGNIGFSLDTGVVVRSCPEGTLKPLWLHHAGPGEIRFRYFEQPGFNICLLIWKGGDRTQAQDISTTVTLGHG